MKKIYTENPVVHWEYVDVKGRRVLDLGCGRAWGHDREASEDGGTKGEYLTDSQRETLPWLTTVEHFLVLGADFVAGVDNRREEIDYLNKLFKKDSSKVDFRLQGVHEQRNLKDVLLWANKPDCIKCDIEGDEFFLSDLDDVVFSSIKEYYIETHSDDLHELMLEKLRSNNYSIRKELCLAHVGEMVRVIFAFKK